MSRLAFSEPSIGSHDDAPGAPAPKTRSPSSSETSVKSSSSASSRCTTAVSAAASIAVVSSPPSPWASTGSRSTRVGSSASTALMSPTASRHTSSHGFTEGGRAGRRSASGRSRSSSAAAPRRGVRRRRRPRSASAAAGRQRRPRRRGRAVRPPPRRRCTRSPRVPASRRTGRRGCPSGPWTTREPSRVTSVTSGRPPPFVSFSPSRRFGSENSRCVGKISSPGSSVETRTTSICALAGVPSSSWKATAVS